MKSSTNLDQIKSDEALPVKVPQRTLDVMEARKQGTEYNSSETSVFSVRYGFRPDSLDTKAEFNLSKNNDEFVIDSPGANEAHAFRGHASDGKLNEYVLSYDPDTESYELLALESTLRVSRSREKAKKSNGLLMPSTNGSGQNSKSASPAPTVQSSSSNSGPSRSTSPVEKASEKVEEDKSEKEVLSNPRSKVGGKSVPNPSAPGSQHQSPQPQQPQQPQSVASKKPPNPQASASQTKPRKQKPVTSALVTKKKNAPAKKQTAGKKPATTAPSSSSAGAAPKPAAPENEEEDYDLGTLADELQESLEDESDPTGGNNGGQEPMQVHQNNTAVESEESDEDEDAPNNNVVMVEPTSKPATKQNSFTLSGGHVNDDGPISLRGYVGGKAEDEDMSSSEEE